MTFDEILTQVVELLQRQGRVSYGALKRRFALDDDYLRDLKDELIDAQRLALDEGGKILVWTGQTAKEETENRRKGESEKGQSLDSELRTPNPQPRDSSRPAAERRQLTVMFCDLVGSTALSEQLDPEELREVVCAYQEACAGVIGRFAGHIAQYLGDGLLVYFGYPLAHEDDAARAVRAGLEIIAELQKRNAKMAPNVGARRAVPLQVRIGIHTGLVVIGEIGRGSRREQLALGDTPNIAARVQWVAEPDTVAISVTTYRLVEGFFTFRDLGPHALKGISSPLGVYQVLAESGIQSRFEVAVSQGLIPLVGREQEVGLLLERWEQAKAGEGQVVLLRGEPGIGKSRLVQVLKDHAGQESAIRIEFRCSSYHQNSAFYPAITHIQRLLQWQREDTFHTKLGKLEKMLAHYRFPQSDTLPLLAALLSLPHPPGFPPLNLSPQRQKKKTQEALVAWLLEESERTVVYSVWEDLHWADPSTLELFHLLFDQISTARMLAVLTFRPEFTLPWRPRPHFTHLTLTRLEQPQVEAMVEKMTGGKALPGEVLQQIVAKTDGVPLFVEELSKMVLESSLLREVNGHYALTSPLPPLAIPATLQDSLMARLDRLATIKEIAQLGATLGREFSYELLHAVSLLDEKTLQQGLRQLVEAELLYQRGLPPQATYLFKHALVQEIAYQSLLRSRRQQYHQQIAQVLEERFTDSTETHPELLAHHYTEASLIPQAIAYWQKAGERATRRSANAEAIAHLTKGLELLKTLPDTPECAQQELMLQISLGVPLITTKGYTAPEVEHVYTRALTLCQQMGEIPQLFPVLRGLQVFYLLRPELQTARELAGQLLTLAQRQHDPALLLGAHFALGQTLFFLGELTPAREHLEQGLALYDPQQYQSLSWAGAHPAVQCLLFGAGVLWLLGYADQALTRSQEALILAQELSHPFSLALALFYTALLHLFRREEQTVRERAEALILLSSEQGVPFWVGAGTIERGWTLAEQGEVEEGIGQIRQGLAAYQARGAELMRPYFLALLSEAGRKAGRAEEGLDVLAEALATAHKTGERFYEAELYRLKGQLTLQQFQVSGSKFQVPSPGTRNQKLETRNQAEAEAEAYFHKAIEIARRQNAKSLELRAVMSLSRLWQQQGKQHEARYTLSAIYNWFTEGFDTKDLQEAKTLLEELSHRAIGD